MGFTKRYINKDMILRNVDNLRYVSRLVRADGLIMDIWSKNFFDNFDFKYESYNKNREEAIKTNSSDLEKLEKLKKLSNILMNLKTNPTWLDINLVSEMIGDKPEMTEIDELSKWYIETIEKQYG